jgi:acyl carrier protein
MVAAAQAPTAEPAATPALIEELAACETDRRLDAIVAHVRGVAASVLGLAARQVDTRKGFFDLGMDSLLSVELRTRLQRSTGIVLPTTLTFKYPTVAAVAEYLLDELTPEAQAAPAVAAGAAKQDDDLSEDELATLLASKLAQIQ